MSGMNVGRPRRRAERRILAVSGQLYTLLLWFCPSPFRREHGAEMAQVFRTWCRETYRQGGTLAVLRLWPRAFSDVVATALLVRLEGGTRMARIRWIRIGNGAIAVASVALIVGALLAIVNELYVYVFTPSDAAWQAERVVFYATYYGSMATPALGLLYLLGLVGLYLRLGERASVWALLGCATGCIGLALFVVLQVGFQIGVGGVKLFCTSAQDCNLYYPKQAQTIYGTLGVITLALIVGGLVLLGLATQWSRASRRDGLIQQFLGIGALMSLAMVAIAPIIAQNTDGWGLLKLTGMWASLRIIWAVGWLLLLRRPQLEAAPAEQLGQGEAVLG